MISDWPQANIDGRRRVLAGETLLPVVAEDFEIARSLAHGHVAAVLGAVRRLGLDQALPKGPERRGQPIPAHSLGRGTLPAPHTPPGAPRPRPAPAHPPSRAARPARGDRGRQL